MPTAAYYREKATRFREMAKDCDESSAKLMETLASDYDELAQGLEPDAEPPLPSEG